MEMKNNDNSKMIHFSFKLNEFENVEIIQKIRKYKDSGYDSQSDLLRDAVMQFFDSYNETNDLDKKIKIQRLRRETAKAEIEEIESKEFVKYYETFGDIPSRQAKNTIHTKATKTKQILQPDRSFICPRCPLRIAESEIYKQVDKLYYHMKNDHNSEYTEDEKNQILAVIEN